MTAVSIVLPAYEEARGIGDVVRGCLNSDASEVIVVDDGSTDQTSLRAGDAGATVVRLPTNRGKGFALRRGAEIANGEVLVFLDADGQDDPSDIPKLVDALAPDVDAVIGSRFLGRFDPGAITRVNRAGNLLLTSVVNQLYGCALTDTQAGFRCVRRSTFLDCKLSAERYDIEVDLVLALLRRRARIVEVPVTRHGRTAGASKLNSVRDGTRILGRILATRLRSLRA